MRPVLKKDKGKKRGERRDFLPLLCGVSGWLGEGLGE